MLDAGLISAGQAVELGSDVVTNGSFTGNANGWTLGAGWAYGANKVTRTPGSPTNLTQSGLPIVEGHLYKITVVVSGITAGTLDITLGDGETFTTGDNETAINYDRPGDTGELVLTPSADFDGSVESVSVEELLGTGQFGSVGIGKTPSENRGIDIEFTGSGGVRAVRADVTDLTVGGSDIEMRALDISAATHGDSTADYAEVMGCGVAMGHQGTGDVGNLVGFSGYVYTESDGDVEQGTGIDAYVQNGGAGAINDMYGVKVGLNQGGSGTIGGLTGIRVDCLSDADTGEIDQVSGITIGAGDLATPANTARGLWVQDMSSMGTDHANILSEGENSKNVFEGLVITPNLPTSAAGLPAGALWNSGGIVHVAP